MTPRSANPLLRLGGSLGLPRVHFRTIASTNSHARSLAGAGAPHGTLVTADAQSAGRGRQGRTWSAPPGRSLLCSIVIRDPPRMLPLLAGVAVASVVDSVGGAGARGADRARGAGETGRAEAKVKWPNDVLVDGRKVAGILVEGRPQERWAVVGVGVNVAVRLEDLPEELADRAGTLGLEPDAREPTLVGLLEQLDRWLSASPSEVLAEVRDRDALLGQPVRWAAGEGIGAGIDGDGRLVVTTADGRVTLEAGEVHLGRT